MKAAFIGGGSLRLLPIFRAIFAGSPEVFRNGEIRLIDRVVERAQAVKDLLLASPEYPAVACRVVVSDDIDEGLKDVDVLYLTMAAVREPSDTQANMLAYEYGYISSDQLSINGAFLSLRLGSFILSLARKLEKLSPRALMLIFPNPVAVYSAMVNKYTSIKALGICGGFNNHRWDLTRICFGKNEFDTNWNVVACGVNHLSYIVRGDYKGEDLYSSLLPRTLTENWQCISMPWEGMPKVLVEGALKDLYNTYRKYNTLIFSTEFDGLSHVSQANYRKFQAWQLEKLAPFDPEKTRQRHQENIEQRFKTFIEASKHPESVEWSNRIDDRSSLFAIDPTDISISIFKALAGVEKMRITASMPNCNGTISNLFEGAAAEFTMDIYKDTITPVPDQYIPSPFLGLTASLAEFQTLLADSVAQNDPKLFAAALDAYPINRFEPNRKEFIQKMFDIYTDIDPDMRRAINYIW